jgi:lipopolysaccharide/colanic/teichoic acid biosynthesis glycosyltransferase
MTDTSLRAKRARERAIACVLLVPAAPIAAVAAAGIWLEGKLDRRARGPVLFREQRVAEGRVVELLKFRTLDAAGLASLGAGPTHIAMLEKQGMMTRSGRLIRQWYLDELPQLWNIARGDFGLVGTRPYPIELYEAELAAGVTRKRDMPAGLVGPVQSRKGTPMDHLALDAEYWEACRTLSAWRLAALDARIVLRSLRVLLQHKGI